MGPPLISGGNQYALAKAAIDLPGFNGAAADQRRKRHASQTHGGAWFANVIARGVLAGPITTAGVIIYQF